MDEARQVPVCPVPGTLELVKDAVVLVKGTQFAAEVIVNLQGKQKQSHFCVL